MTVTRIILINLITIVLFSCKSEKEVIYPIIINETISSPWNYYDYDLTGDGETDISLYIGAYSGTGGRNKRINTELNEDWNVKTCSKIDSICHTIHGEGFDGDTYQISGSIQNCYLQYGNGLLRFDTTIFVNVLNDEELDNPINYNVSSSNATLYAYASSVPSSRGKYCDPITICSEHSYKSAFRDRSKGIIVFENQSNEKYGLRVEWLERNEQLIVKEVLKIE